MRRASARLTNSIDEAGEKIMLLNVHKAKVGGMLLALACVSQLFQSALAAYPYYYNPYYQGYAQVNPYTSVYTPYAGAYNPYSYNPYGGVYNPYYNPNYKPSVFTTHPVLSGTLLGGTVGALGGAAVGAMQSEGEHGGAGKIGEDTAIGAGAGAALGAGVGLIRHKVVYGSWL
jgi:hypothetical protein